MHVNAAVKELQCFEHSAIARANTEIVVKWV